MSFKQRLTHDLLRQLKGVTNLPSVELLMRFHTKNLSFTKKKLVKYSGKIYSYEVINLEEANYKLKARNTKIENIVERISFIVDVIEFFRLSIHCRALSVFFCSFKNS